MRTFLIPQEGDNFRGCLPFSEPYLNITLFLKRLAKFSFRNRAVASKESSQTLQNIWSEVVYDGIKSNPNDVLDFSQCEKRENIRVNFHEHIES